MGHHPGKKSCSEYWAATGKAGQREALVMLVGPLILVCYLSSPCVILLLGESGSGFSECRLSKTLVGGRRRHRFSHWAKSGQAVLEKHGFSYTESIQWRPDHLAPLITLLSFVTVKDNSEPG
jgi:hypothetical protein